MDLEEEVIMEMRKKTLELAAIGLASWSALFIYTFISKQHAQFHCHYSHAKKHIFFRVLSHILTHIILQVYCEVDKQVIIIPIVQIHKS